jgi:dihydroorotate dehydrogenase (fumarate)
VPNLTLLSAWELRTAAALGVDSLRQGAGGFCHHRGVHTYEDVFKGVMAGANVTMMASDLLRNGVKRIRPWCAREVARWLEDHEYTRCNRRRAA